MSPLKNKKVFFDIGANYGTITSFCALNYPNLTIYAFEPSKRLYLKLKELIQINNFNNVKLYNIAISGKNGETLFYDSEFAGSSSVVLDNKPPKIVDEYLVETVTIEKFCNDNHIDKIDFLKLDAEGVEYEILSNENVYKFIDYLAVEIHYFGKFSEYNKLIDLIFNKIDKKKLFLEFIIQLSYLKSFDFNKINYSLLEKLLILFGGKNLINSIKCSAKSFDFINNNDLTQIEVKKEIIKRLENTIKNNY